MSQTNFEGANFFHCSGTLEL